MHRVQKRCGVRAVDVATLQVVVKADVAVTRRQRQGNHRRQSIATVPSILDRRLAGRSPGTTAIRLQHKATFVEKNDASLPTKPPFLSAANPACANDEWSPRRVPAHVVPVSDKSNPRRARCGAHDRRDRSRQIAAGSGPPREGTSTDRYRSQMRADLLSAKSLIVVSAEPSVGVGDQDADWIPVLPSRPLPACLSNALPKNWKHVRFLPPPESPCLRARVARQSDAVPLIPQCFR